MDWAISIKIEKGIGRCSIAAADIRDAEPVHEHFPVNGHASEYFFGAGTRAGHFLGPREGPKTRIFFPLEKD